MNLKQTAKDNPTMTVLTSLAALAVAAVSINQGIELSDALIMTEAEARVIHDGYDVAISDVGERMDEQAILSECRWLSDKVDAIEYEIYVLTRDKASADFIRSKTITLKKHRDKYDAMRCVTKL